MDETQETHETQETNGPLQLPQAQPPEPETLEALLERLTRDVEIRQAWHQEEVARSGLSTSAWTSLFVNTEDLARLLDATRGLQRSLTQVQAQLLAAPTTPADQRAALYDGRQQILQIDVYQRPDGTGLMTAVTHTGR